MLTGAVIIFFSESILGFVIYMVYIQRYNEGIINRFTKDLSVYSQSVIASMCFENACGQQIPMLYII